MKVGRLKMLTGLGLMLAAGLCFREPRAGRPGRPDASRS